MIRFFTAAPAFGAVFFYSIRAVNESRYSDERKCTGQMTGAWRTKKHSLIGAARIKSQTEACLQPHAYPYRKEGVGGIDNAVAKVLLSCDWQANMRTAKPIGGGDKSGHNANIEADRRV